MEYSYDKEEHHKSNKTTSAHHGQPYSQHHAKPSNSELLSSAKIVANAAKAKFQHDPNYKFDKNEVAGAADNILHAASHYGKLDEKGGSLGKVVEKAENYLHQYHSSHSSSTTTTTTSETLHTKPGKDHGQGHSGGGYGDYMKMAEGLLNKHSAGSDSAGAGGEHAHNSGSGGYGDYIKMAGDFLKK